MKPTKQNDQLTHPQTIIDEHLASALKPYAKALLEAAVKDAALEAEMNETHPDVVKKQAEQLFEAACNGDKKADATLREADGTQGFIEAKTRFFDLTRGKCRAGAKADASIWDKAAPAACAALDAALVVIRQQWNKALETLGEEMRPSAWEGRIAMMRRAIEQTPFNARELMHGTNWQIESLGLRRVLE